MDTLDFVKGDPAVKVLGKPDEKPARVHAPQKPKPGPTARSILASIKLRRQELEPVVKEARDLEDAVSRLKHL